MNRIDIINHLIKTYNYKSYLEIGVQKGVSFDAVKVIKKIGVDPDLNSKATHKIISNDFFKQYKEKFDIIFIDGLHESDQVCVDILNSLNRLNDNGVIICHDMLPTSKAMQDVPRVAKEWTGDCWKAFVRIRQLLSNLEMYTVDTDYGCGVIRKCSLENKQTLIPIYQELTYNNFVQNKEKWMNIITVKEFKQIFK